MFGVDTIPKPDGLGPVLQTADIEQNSIDFGPRSREVEGCSIAFELRVLENSKTRGTCPLIRRRSLDSAADKPLKPARAQYNLSDFTAASKEDS